MKKTITKPDGTTEVVEGTAEEIAEYERKLRGDVQEAPKPKGPGLLTDELQRLLDGARKFEQPLSYPIMQHDPNCDIVRAGSGWWSVVPPRCTCGLFAYPIPGGTIRYTYTTDKIQVGDILPDPWVVTCSSTSAPRT